MLLKSLAAVALTAVASYGCTVTPAVPAAQMARVVRPGSPPVTSMPFYIPVAVSSGCTPKFGGLFNAYPLVATFGPIANQPGTLGITLADSGAPLPVLPFNATGIVVLEAIDSSGQTTTATITAISTELAIRWTDTIATITET
jgi:hypothetical protein